MTSKTPTRSPRTSNRRASDRHASERYTADRRTGSRYRRAAASPGLPASFGHPGLDRCRTEAARIEQAAAILDRLDIARHLLRLEVVNSRTALALQLLEQTADEVADLAGLP